LLVLPELAFSGIFIILTPLFLVPYESLRNMGGFPGYNFKSLSEISFHLEPTAAGPSTVWARSIAKRLGCHVILGYPEFSARSPEEPVARYNSAVLVSPEGDVLANYRKSFLFTTDESWAEEGPSGFFSGEVPGGLGRLAMGICMDLNPKHFTAPFDKYEFAHHILNSNSMLVVMPMAWLTLQHPDTLTEQAQVPDADTLAYWVQRLQPLIDTQSPEEIIFIACNRIGEEGDAAYAGTSAVVGVKDGNVKVYGCLGRGTEDLLVCDVPSAPVGKFAGVELRG